MTLEEYKRYFNFCSEMGKTPLSFNDIKYTKIDKMMSMVKENFNIFDLKYIKYMNQWMNKNWWINKYINKKYWNVNLKIK